MDVPRSLFDSTWEELEKLLVNRWQTYLWYLICSLVFIYLIFLLIAWLLLGQLPQLQQAFSNGFHYEALPFMTLLEVAVILLGSFFVYAMLWFGFHRVAVDKTVPQSPAMILTKGSEVFFKTFFSYVAASLLLILAVMVVLSLPFFIGYLINSYLSLLFFIAAFLYLFYWFPKVIFYWYRIVLQNDGPIEAIKKSAGLVKARWWSVTGIFIVLGILSVVISVVSDFAIEYMFSFISDSVSSFSLRLEAMIQMKNFAGIGDLFREMFQPEFILTNLMQSFFQSVFLIFAYYGSLALYLALERSDSGHSLNK